MQRYAEEGEVTEGALYVSVVAFVKTMQLCLL